MATEREIIAELQKRVKDLETTLGSNPELATSKAHWAAQERQRLRFRGFTELAGVADPEERGAKFLALSFADRREAAKFLGPKAALFVAGISEDARAIFLEHSTPDTRAAVAAEATPPTKRYHLAIGPSASTRLVCISTAEIGPLDADTVRELIDARLQRQCLQKRGGAIAHTTSWWFTGVDARRGESAWILREDQLKVLLKIDGDLRDKIAIGEIALVPMDEARSRAMDKESW